MDNQSNYKRGPWTIGLLRSPWSCRYLTTFVVWSLLFVAASVGSLFSQCLTRYVNSAEGEAVITVLPEQRALYRIPRTIFGTFLEHIGQSVFGGVSAQLLDNPSLEPYPASPETINARFSAAVFRQSTRFNLPLPWLPLRPSGRRYELRLGTAANSVSYLYVMGLPGSEVGIRQSIYLPVERERSYQGVLFASTAEGALTLSVSFRRHDRPNDILAESTLQVPDQGLWVKLPFQLTLAAGTVAPLETIDFAVAVKDGRRFSVDEIRLYPADADGGLDPEIVHLAQELNSPLLRYGGNFSSGYHWQDGVGPLDSRPTRINEAWGIPEYNEFGTDEFMEFCHRIGSLPQICLNLGSGSVEEAHEWVEYCQGSPNSTQGRRRAAHGHPQPYSMGAWEFGNELYDDTQLGWYQPEGYAARYLDFFRAIAPIVPAETPLLATGGELNAFDKWNGALLHTAGRELRYVTTHLVADLEQTLNRKADLDAVVAADLALPVGVGRALGKIRAQIDADPLTSNRVKVAYSEWMFRSPAGSRLPNFDNMGGAVIAAAWLNMLARNADWIPIANMTGLVEFGGIHKRRGRVYVTPQYWDLYLYSKYAGDTVIGTETRVRQYDVHAGQSFAPEIPAVPYLDVLGTANSKNGDVSLFVVNRSPKSSQPVSIHLSGFTPPKNVKVVTLASPSLVDTNDEEHQYTVRPVESHDLIEGTALRHALPAASVTVFSFSGSRRK
jgi:alpha-L-arabinofuranosidase